MSRPSRPNSLRRQLLTRLLGPLALLLLLDAFSAYRFAVYYANQTYDAWLYDSARALAQQVKLAGGQARLDLPRAAIEMFEWDSVDRTFYAASTSRQGRIFGNASFPPPPERPPAGMRPVHYDETIDGVPVRAVAIALPLASGSPGDTIVVQVAETLGKRNLLARELVVSTLIPQGLLMLAAAVVVGLGVAGGLRPLATVAEQIRRRHSGDLSPLSVDVPIEVAPLTGALNRLFAELDEAQRSQQRFIADAAHQLRTPLATLQVQAERALRESDPVAGAQAVRQVLTATQRLGHLVHQLLTLARAEPAAAAAAEPCDLGGLARDAAAQWVPQAIEHDIDLGYSGPDAGPIIRGSPLLLRELINNLVDNALKYGRKEGGGTRVTVGVEAGPPVRLWVEDNGPGIPEADREQVLERFVRLPGSHASGSGLGLSIVREIAARHGAEVAITAGAGGKGTRIVLGFAAAATASAEAAADDRRRAENAQRNSMIA